ncbi:MAG: peptide chain release factor N(5)-glutamine methyltransferase [Burkholderiaceae bacterium]
MTHTVAALLAASALPLLEARALLAHRLQVARERLIAHPELAVDDNDAHAFMDLASRRAVGEPLAYLLGEKEFYGRSFTVSPDVLVPRPETELLVELALDKMRPIEQPRVLDLGTGSGCVAVTLALECAGAQVTATDASPAALQVARGNANRLGATVAFRLGDWYGALPVGGAFDVIVANPPYVAPGDPHLHALRFEPMQALTAGQNGLACLHTIVGGAAVRLAPAGWLLVEHGYDQAAAVRALFASGGLSARTRTDGAGHPRVTLGRVG